MNIRHAINLIESSHVDHLPINISGVDAPDHWIDSTAPADANAEYVAVTFNPFYHSGKNAHAEIGTVGGKPCWILSIEDGEESNPYYWTNGRCAAFAQAMNRIYGLPIWATLERNVTAEQEGDEDPASLYSLIHAFVVAGKFAIDEKGATPLAKLTAKNGKPIRGDRFFDGDQCVYDTRETSVGELESFHESDCHGSMAAIRHIQSKKAFYDALVKKAVG